MIHKSVSKIIIDEFSKSIHKDVLFKDIADDFIASVQKKKRNKSEIENVLRKKNNENTES